MRKRKGFDHFSINASNPAEHKAAANYHRKRVQELISAGLVRYHNRAAEEHDEAAGPNYNVVFPTREPGIGTYGDFANAASLAAYKWENRMYAEQKNR